VIFLTLSLSLSLSLAECGDGIENIKVPINGNRKGKKRKNEICGSVRNYIGCENTHLLQL
jgi:hypothetical protein